MTKPLSALALLLAFNTAQADVFAPWSVSHANTAPDAPATVAAPGFAPWRDGPRVMDAPDAMQIGELDPRAFFSPWS